jgi:RNA polymerase sigma-70 factor, ECF subfamily
VPLRRSADRPGHDTSLRAVYDEYAGELFAFAHRSLGDAAQAEEAVQLTFLRAWRSARRGDRPTRAWLFALCRAVVLERARPASHDTAGSSAKDGAQRRADPGRMERLLVGMQVEEGLRRLSGEHRRVLVEVHVRGRPPADVAVEARIPVGTVRSRVYYALKAMRLVVEEMGWEA